MTESEIIQTDSSYTKRMSELEATERFIRHQENKDGEAAVHLDAIIKRIDQRFHPISSEDDDSWTWSNVTCRDLEALGWDQEHRKRIAPNWGCKAQEWAFSRMSELLRVNGAIVALVGHRGVGKTAMASEHSRLRVEARRRHFVTPEGERAQNHPPAAPGRYEKLGRISNIFKPLYADFGTTNHDQLAGMLDRWCRLDLVVLDEIHETEDLKTNMRFLVDFVDRRYANKKDTVLISNHTPEQFMSEINPSIVSRMGQYGAVIPCDWESFRK